MKKKFISPVALLCFVLLAVSLVLVPQSAEAVAAYEFYGDYTDVAKIYDYNSCPSIQGVAVGSQKLYSIKINGSDSAAFISMSDKDTGETVKLYNADAGSYMFTYLDHANDMDVWGIDGPSNLFVATTKKGAQGIVRLRRDGNDLTKVAEYHLKCDGADICATAMSIMSVSNGQINFITKWGMDLYTGSISTSVTNGTLNMKKLCTITKSQAYIKDTYNDLSAYVNQGMGYHKGMLYLPISGDDANLNRSVILVYNLLNVKSASELVYPLEHLSFRVTSGAYSALFELESCDICSDDNKLYFGVQRRKTSSDTDHDGVASFNGYTFSVVESQTTHYTVRYDANGGTGTMADSRVSYGYKMPLRTNTFTRDGWTFAGWAAYRHSQDQWYYTNGTSSKWYKAGSQPADYTAYSLYADGVTVAQSTAVDNDTVTMYAQWTPTGKSYTIKYDPNGGTGTMEDTLVAYGYNTPLRKNTFTRTGYKFVGWTAYRTSQAQWYYTDGTSSGWYAEGSQPAGYTKSVYRDEVNVAKTSAVDGDIIYMYAQWEKTCTHSYTSKVTTAATCTTAGVKTFTCGSCGDSYTETIAATGHNYGSVVTAPTCTAGGYTTYTCTGCGHTYTGNDTAAAGHSYKSVVTAPTCTAEGYTTYTCSACGHSYKGDTTAVTGHDYASVVTAPTCTAEGYTTYTCRDCGHSYQGNTTPKGQHSYKSVVTAPTCTTGGYTTYTCVNCGDSYTGDVVGTSGHNFVSGTCSVCGQGCEHDWADGKCTLCRASYPVRDYYLFGWINGANYACEDDYENMGIYKFVDGKLTATFKEASYVAVKAEGNADWYMAYTYPGEGITACTLFNTKTGSGEKLYVPGGKQITFTLVSNGDDSFTLSYVAKACPHAAHDIDGNCTACGQYAGHNYTSKTTEATCTVPGSTVSTCAGCGHSDSQTIPAKGHLFGGWYEAVTPGCTEQGQLARVCTTCGSKETQPIAATGHSWQAADCDTPKNCSNCGATEDAPLGHTYGSVVTAPTCTKAGYTTFTCVVCGHSYTGAAVPATGHSYVGGTCTGCGQADPDAVTDPGLVLNYPTLSFEDEIIYNVYFSVKDTTSVVEMGLMVLPKMDQNATIADAVALVPGYVTNGVVYLAKSEGIP
ncbi:MAG: InlB B-repeat-containing protein, partial [Oscillospiraceae bacterium]|nr:InlB B-repeat-containing protein [Oscillospiraceae bacterium]